MYIYQNDKYSCTYYAMYAQDHTYDTSMKIHVSHTHIMQGMKVEYNLIDNTIRQIFNLLEFVGNA